MNSKTHSVLIRLLQPGFAAGFMYALLPGLPVSAHAASVEERLALIEELVATQALEIASLKEELARRETGAVPEAPPTVVPVFAATRPEPISKPDPVFVTPLGKAVNRLNLGGRLQVQYAYLGTDIDGAADPADTNHFFVRRAYLTTRPVLNESWSGNFSYNLAGSYFTSALIQHKADAGTFDLGLRKVNFGYEERISSANLRAIERSGVTRYFVEPVNGRRLGAGSYRVGAFFDGRSDDVFYGIAVTNPERTGDSSFAGSGSSNRLAFWANGGIGFNFDHGKTVFGTGLGFLPDQGGAAPGQGSDLVVGSLYSDTTLGYLNLIAEVLYGDADHASPWGFYIQPALMFTDRIEGVARFSYLDTDGRGINLSDGIRSAPGGGTMDKLYEAYLGANWYISGNDLKVQGGLVYGRSEDAIAGGSAKADTFGVRSMFQFQY